MILLFNKLTMKTKFMGKIIFIYIYIYDLFVIFTLIGGIKIYLFFFWITKYFHCCRKQKSNNWFLECFFFRSLIFNTINLLNYPSYLNQLKLCLGAFSYYHAILLSYNQVGWGTNWSFRLTKKIFKIKTCLVHLEHVSAHERTLRPMRRPLVVKYFLSRCHWIPHNILFLHTQRVLVVS
jgi:hypothetical protein